MRKLCLAIIVLLAALAASSSCFLKETSTKPAPPEQSASPTMTWQALANKWAESYGLDARVLKATVEAETNGKNVAGDNNQAFGYGQVWPKWHSEEIHQAARDALGLKISTTNVQELGKLILQYPEVSMATAALVAKNYWESSGDSKDFLKEHFTSFFKKYVGPGITQQDLERRWKIWQEWFTGLEGWQMTITPKSPDLVLSMEYVQISYVAPDHDPPPIGVKNRIRLSEIPGFDIVAKQWLAPVPVQIPTVLQVTRNADRLSASFEFAHPETKHLIQAEVSGTIAGDDINFEIIYRLPAELQSYSKPFKLSLPATELKGTIKYSMPPTMTETFTGTINPASIDGQVIQGTFSLNINGQFMTWLLHEKQYSAIITILGEAPEYLWLEADMEWTLSDLKFGGDFSVTLTE